MIICLSANSSWYLYNFRKELIKRLIANSYTVITISPHDNFSHRLERLGCKTYSIDIDSKGLNPFKEVKTFLQYLALYRAIRPNAVNHFTIKPVLYGSISAMILNIKSINTITGLGTAFLAGNVLRLIATRLLKVALYKSHAVFFQNANDRSLFLRSGIISSSRAILVPGSGINLNYYSLNNYSNASLGLFLLPARMLWDKGIGEFVEAARIVKTRGLEARFRLVGPTGVSNRTSIPVETISMWTREGVVEYQGMVDDIRPTLASASCVVLPSYREGMSRILLEACAVGRPIITTDVPGCRDVVTDGLNGFLCKPRDSLALANVFERFLLLPLSEKKNMAAASRSISEQFFDENAVNKLYLAQIRSLVETTPYPLP
jgi:glycosyltransferase involved in cell wall biosynthesis